MTPESLQGQAALIGHLTESEWLFCRKSTMAMLKVEWKPDGIPNNEIAFQAAKDLLTCKVETLELLYSNAIQKQNMEEYKRGHE